MEDTPSRRKERERETKLLWTKNIPAGVIISKEMLDNSGRGYLTSRSFWTVMSDHLEFDTQEKYSSELYGFICGLTSGEAKKIVGAISEKHNMLCGFSALIASNNGSMR